MGEVLVFSDLHIHSHKGSRERLGDCLQVLEWVFRTARDRGLRDILFLGDLFHDRTRLDILTIHRTQELFETYFGVPEAPNLYLLLGNHDMWSRDKWDVYSPKVVSAWPTVQIIDKPSTIRFGLRDIDFLPFTENPIVDLAHLKATGGGRILCAHMAIDGATLNSFGIQADVCVEHDNEMVRLDVDFLKGWQRVLLGHYHAPQRMNDTVEYVGSPLQLTFSEAGQDKHLLVLDLETLGREYIPNTFSRRHIITTPAEAPGQELANNFVMIKVEDLAAAEVVELRRRIHQEHAVASLEIRCTPRAEADADAVEGARTVLDEEDRMLERYIGEKGCGELDAALLLAVGTRITEGVPCPT